MDEKMMAERFRDAAKNLGRLGAVLCGLPEQIRAQAHEIRLRCGRPVVVSLAQGDVFVTQDGAPACRFLGGLLTAGRADIDEAFRLICNYSVHSHQQEIKNGFVTLRGGHRAGICGTAVLQGDTIVNIRDISSINLRIARQINGAADGAAEALFSGGRLYGGLVIGPPGCGKTTVLRDLARQLSSGVKGGRCLRVAVVDERSEIAATYAGQPQNDLGPTCDVLDGYPKGEGIMQAVRSLSPDVILCDELGGEADAKAVTASLNAGVAVIASVHASSLQEVFSRPHLAALLRTGAFRRGILLCSRDHPGKIKAVYEEGELNAYQGGGYAADLHGLRCGGAF